MPEVEVNRFPPWLKKKLDVGGRDVYTREVIDSLSLHTVCDSAKCPNINECFSRGTATFLILGNVCTRNCSFCAVDSGVPEGTDYDEALRVAAAAKRLNLRHVVITSVTRDDLEDGGASHFAATIRAVRDKLPLATIEVLTPDFNGKKEAIRKVLEAEPTIFNHNVETVPRLYKWVRAGADYKRSLSVLRYARGYSAKLRTKSGLMLGMGEEKEEVVNVLEDLKSAGCEMITIGQYLKPSNGKLEVFRFVHPDEFKEYGDLAKALGFRHVASAPFVRSSYCADQWVETELQTFKRNL